MEESSDVSFQTQHFIHCAVNIYPSQYKQVQAAFPAGHILKLTFTIKMWKCLDESHIS